MRRANILPTASVQVARARGSGHTAKSMETFMKTALVTLSTLAGALAITPSAHAAPASIAGNWKTDDGTSVVAFYKCGNAMCGKVDRFLVSAPADGVRDTENPKKNLRNRNVLGLRIFWDLTPDGDRYEGKGYSPRDGRYFNAKIRRDGNRLNVKGCVAVFCRTVQFTRF